MIFVYEGANEPLKTSTKVASPIIRQIKDNRDALDYFESVSLQTEDEKTQDIIMKFPTVYIHNWKESEDFEVYVGESNDIFKRTRQHYDASSDKSAWQRKLLEKNFSNLLATNNYFFKMVNVIIEYGIRICEDQYGENYSNTNLTLYQKYTYEDVCRLLNWQKNLNARNMGGYFYDQTTKTLPVFINYDKDEEAIAYEDRFVTPDNLIALSKPKRRVNSKDADYFYKRKDSDKDNKFFCL